MNFVDIGTWLNYNVWIDKEQKRVQLDNLIEVPIENGLGNVKFIYTNVIEKMNNYLSDLVKQIKITDSSKTIVGEVYYTSTIEGANTTIGITQEIHDGIRVPKNKSEIMVKNGFDAVKELNLYGSNLTIDKMIHMWNTIVRDCCENESVRGERFRVGDVRVGSFIPVHYTKVESLMNKFMDFWYSKELSDYPFIKTILLHYSYETIHPFCDGNGRLGRLLLNNYLVVNGIEAARALSFSPEICRTRSRFDVSITDSENVYNDCTPFIMYMLETMIISCENILSKMNITSNESALDKMLNSAKRL